MAATKAATRGDALTCTTCGLVVVVDELCGCAEAHEVICCERPMERVRTRAKPKAVRKPKAAAKA